MSTNWIEVIKDVTQIDFKFVQSFGGFICNDLKPYKITMK